jgi:phosphoadenosine phosphosulfate reductase
VNLPVINLPPGASITPDTPTDTLVAWSLERFAHQRLMMTTSFGMEGCALIDMYARHQVPLTIVYLDTMFFFPETYALRDRMAERYPHFTFVNRGTTLTAEEQAALHGPELWKHNPDLCCKPELWKHNPDLCCKLRKVDPMNAVMKEADVWITGLRRSQSVSRANLQLMEWDWKYLVLKFNPLYLWERDQVWAYIQEHQVPYNPLHERGYPTVGCTHCTQPVEGSQIGEYTRSGRWAELNKTECGLHGDGI